MIAAEDALLENLTATEQHQLMKALRPSLTINLSQVARMANVSRSTVQYVFEGFGKNKEVAKIIFDHLPANWMDHVPANLLEKIQAA